MVHKKVKISLVIPIYNEELNIASLYGEIKEVFAHTNKTHEVIFVDDCSHDNSPEVLEDIAKKDNGVKVIRFQRNFGQTAALSAGIDHACGEIIIPMDGDGQNDPADIPALVKKIEEGYSVVSGWRKNRHDPFIRVLPSKIANWIIRRVSGVPIHDNGCSLKAYRKEVIEGVNLYGEMHRFISVYASWSGGKVTEVIVNHRPRKFGKSKYGFARIIKVILDLFVIKFLLTYINRPMHFFGKYGFYAFALSIGFAIWSAALKVYCDISISRTPLPIISMMLLIVAVQLIMTGILAELMMRTYYESQNRKPYIIAK